MIDWLGVGMVNIFSQNLAGWWTRIWGKETKIFLLHHMFAGKLTYRRSFHSWIYYFFSEGLCRSNIGRSGLWTCLVNVFHFEYQDMWPLGYNLFIAIFIELHDFSFIIASVYIPPSKILTAQNWESITALNYEIKITFPSIPMIVTGNFTQG